MSEAKRKNIPPTTYYGQILDKYTHYLLDKELRGDIMVGRKVLELMLNSDTDKDYEINAEKAAKYVNAETMIQINAKKISYDQQRDRIKMWHEINGFKFNETEEDGIKRWYVLHNMGQRWSKFQCLMYKNLLANAGMTSGKIYFDEICFWIEFKKDQKA